MKKELLKWKLDGENMKHGDGVDFSAYMESMRGIFEVLEDIYAREGGGHLKVRIVEAKKGSLDTVFGILADPSIVSGIFQGISSVKDLLDFFSEYTSLMKIFGGKDPASVNFGHTISADETITINGNGNNVTVHKNTYNYYSDKPDIRKKTAHAFSAIQSDTLVDTMKFETEDGATPVQFTRKDFEELSQSDYTSEKGDDIKIEKQIVKISPIKSVYDSRDRKWEFITQSGRKISARIRDASFWDLIYDEKKPFQTGPRDVFEVEWQYTRKRDPMTGLFVEMENSYEIVRVIGKVDEPLQTKI